MSLEINAENRSASMPIRCCSFCRRPGHDIRRCESPDIRNFERNTINYIYFNFNISEGRFNDTDKIIVKQYLLNIALTDKNVIRAYAISRCGATIRSDLARCVDMIIQHLMNINEEEETNQIENSIETENISLLHAVMFIEMIRAIKNSSRKFDIKTCILENSANLEEKCECGICYEECANKNIIKLNCGHEFCKDCIKQTLQNERKLTPCCAYCRTDITNFELKSESVKNEFNDLIHSKF